MMQQANLNIGSIGQQLEAARRAKGVTVSEAGHATKILSKFIEAMESDDFGVMSAPVYAKGFIRMYAEYLGLDSRPLVDEYIVQHSPKTKGMLNDEVRQKLVQADQLAADGEAAAPAAKPAVPGRRLSNHGNFVLTQLSGSGLPLKWVFSAVGSVLLLGIIVVSVAQCSENDGDEPAPVAGGAASVQHETIANGIPDVYLVRPGEIEVAP